MHEPDLRSVAFPTLSKEQIESLAGCAEAKRMRFADGETLFEVGDRDPTFFVVDSGRVEIVDPSGDKPTTVAIHEPGEFTGDVSHLTGNPSVVTAVARGDVRVYAISGDAIREVLNQCAELSDVLLQAFLARRQLLHESETFTGIRVIGSRYSQDTFRIRDFLAKNRVLFRWLDLETHPDVDRLLASFGLTKEDTPVVSCGRKPLLRNPGNRELAEALGIRRPLEHGLYDLVVVGAGPAGLAAAVYAASEGLRTVMVERLAPGGQAGASMRIENYLGFPTGLTGAELTDRAVIQANKFGARLSVPTPVRRLAFENEFAVLTLDDGETVTAKCLLIATGAEYRRLEVDGCERFEGRGVYYAATPNEAQTCRGADVVVVGAGNSAGQAVVFLASQARKVTLVVRGGDLFKSMSSYLAHRIQGTPNVEILYDTTVVRMDGDGHLASVEVSSPKTGERRTIRTPALFSFIGATPRTEWLPPEIETDAKGFVRTGPGLRKPSDADGKRDPFLLETSRRGVFAAGDVRSGSVKRVASAVGEGAMAVQFVHEYLKEV